ncbi:MAG: hypothetical protein GXO39_08790 [Thermotogae bacterium]|nr:hypothetical protein [Thermotogota bacterium]
MRTELKNPTPRILGRSLFEGLVTLTIQAIITDMLYHSPPFYTVRSHQVDLWISEEANFE